MPLHVEVLYNDYQFSAAFAVASLLTLLAVMTLVLKSMVEWRSSAPAPADPGAAKGEIPGADAPVGGSDRMSIEVRNIRKTFDNYVALRDVSLNVR